MKFGSGDASLIWWDTTKDLRRCTSAGIAQYQVDASADWALSAVRSDEGECGERIFLERVVHPEEIGMDIVSSEEIADPISSAKLRSVPNRLVLGDQALP